MGRGSGTEIANAARMGSINYRDLIAWQKAMDFVKAVYKATESMPADERFGLVRQMRRAGVSIPANIAEGEGRRYSGAFLNHLSIAYGSLRELETHLILAQRLRHLSPEQVEPLLLQAAEVGRLINGLIRSKGAPC